MTGMFFNALRPFVNGLRAFFNALHPFVNGLRAFFNALRCGAFHIAFVLVNLVLFLLCLPFLVLERRKFRLFFRIWARANRWIVFHLGGIRAVVEGRELLPDGGYIVAIKHQSAWETVALICEFPDPCFLLKKELGRIPLFGLYVRRLGHIQIDRSKRRKAILDAEDAVRQAIREGRQVIIFPEGTRRLPEAPPRYKRGVGHLYMATHSAVVPVAHNAGLYWPRRHLLLSPGCVRVAILPAIGPGLSHDAFMDKLEKVIEGRVALMMREVAQAHSGLPALRAQRALKIIDSGKADGEGAGPES